MTPSEVSNMLWTSREAISDLAGIFQAQSSVLASIASSLIRVEELWFDGPVEGAVREVLDGKA